MLIAMQINNPENYLKYGELGILLAVLVLVLPALFLLIYRLNTANRQAEQQQRQDFSLTLGRMADAFEKESESNRRHCSEELNRIASNSETQMKTIVQAIRG